MMKRISLLSIVVVIAFAALLFAWVASIRNSRRLEVQLDAIRAAVDVRRDELQQLADRQAAELELLHKSTKLLAGIHESPEHADIAAFIAKMEGGSLPCSVRPFPGSEEIALFVFHEPFSDSRIATRPIHERRSAQLLVDTDALSIKDSVMHVGYRSESITESAGSEPVWKTHYEFSNGRRITYQVLPTGFKEVK